MTTSRFDQLVDVPYGTCETCGEVLATQAVAREHMSATHGEAKKVGRSAGHSVLITNLTREDRIENAVESLVEDAVAGVTDELEGLIQAGHITREEATAAVARWSDFDDGWQEAGGVAGD